MKLNEELLGKKVRRSTWTNAEYFIPLAFTSTGWVIGEFDNGSAGNFRNSLS